MSDFWLTTEAFTENNRGILHREVKNDDCSDQFFSSDSLKLLTVVADSVCVTWPDRLRRSWISDKDFPLVSGTMKKTKISPRIESPEKSQKVSPVPMASTKLGKVFVMTKAKTQLVVPATGPANPLTSDANNSPIMSHGTGPNPKENMMIKMQSETIGNHPRLETCAAS